jgi:hypothetical protein
MAGKVARPRMVKRKARERTWVALPDPAPGVTEDVYLAFPGPPDAEALEEARVHLAALEAHGRIAREGARSGAGTTHAIETDARGHRRLVRKRATPR